MSFVHDLYHNDDSPPRAWGQLVPPAENDVALRFTPTCVGTTFPDAHRRRDLYDSPPRAWGQRFSPPARRRGGRFTPTCVGTTCRPCQGDRRFPIHPHVRGDNRPRRGEPPPVLDSPPRAWGQRQFLFAHSLHLRFTPTCVGTTHTPGGCSRSTTIHPHVRGDNNIFSIFFYFFIDSPPRAWGQLPKKNLQTPYPRFTPTCVGTTSMSGIPRNSIAVHPHVRGDNPIFNRSQGEMFGSPPRAWGQRARENRVERWSRFTPTCVGTTDHTRLPKMRAAVHPHVRGDNDGHSRLHRIGLGSPPRAWGQPRRAGQRAQ